MSSQPRIQELVLAWAQFARDNKIPLSGAMIKEKAMKFAKQLEVTEFAASSGWLSKFLKRNGIVQKIISGEGASVSEVDCEMYCNEILPELLLDYEEDDILNADKMGLFFKCSLKKTLAFCNEKCQGGKHSKE